MKTLFVAAFLVSMTAGNALASGDSTLTDDERFGACSQATQSFFKDGAVFQKITGEPNRWHAYIVSPSPYISDIGKLVQYEEIWMRITDDGGCQVSDIRRPIFRGDISPEIWAQLE